MTVSWVLEQENMQNSFTKSGIYAIPICGTAMYAFIQPKSLTDPIGIQEPSISAIFSTNFHSHTISHIKGKVLAIKCVFQNYSHLSDTSIFPMLVKKKETKRNKHPVEKTFYISGDFHLQAEWIFTMQFWCVADIYRNNIYSIYVNCCNRIPAGHWCNTKKTTMSFYF